MGEEEEESSSADISGHPLFPTSGTTDTGLGEARFGCPASTIFPVQPFPSEHHPQQH